MLSYWQMGEDLHDDDDDEDDEDSLGLSLLSWRPCRRFVVGLDLGQTQDFTAVAVVHRSAGRDGVVQVPYLERFPLGTSYLMIVGRMAKLLATPPLRGQASLVVDRTGVGGAVVDLLAEAKLSPIAVTITGGDKVHRDSKTRYSVPKRELVGCLQVLLQTGQLKIASALPESEILVKELLNFQVKITASAHDTYGAWREGAHDDLVLAVALACWYGEQGGRR
jgi:hypothetical protein